MLSPLRYPGGKAQYIKLIESYANLTKHDRYVEPFAGGAAIALHFAINRHTPVVLNDMDPAIYAFWRYVLEQPEEFIDRILDTPVDIQQWQNCKVIFTKKEQALWKDLGFATFFQNRCNFSGCLTANPIGGIKQNGKWLIDARFNKKNLISKIKKISEFQHLIEFSNLDALDLLTSKINQNDFIYLDPPYVNAGKYLYSNYLKKDGHIKLAEVLKQIKSTWIMSYDNSPIIEELYFGFELTNEVTVKYSFSRKIKENELLIFNRPNENRIF